MKQAFLIKHALSHMKPAHAEAVKAWEVFVPIYVVYHSYGRGTPKI
jgi:hypothetical protein